MALVKVWNDNVHPFSQEFKGKTITVPPKEYVEMDYEEAVEFKGKFSPIDRDGDGNPRPESYKMIRVERPKQAVAKPDELINHATGQRAATKEELQSMLSQFTHLLVKDQELDKAAGGEVDELKKQNLELQARLEAIESMLAAQAKKAPKK